MIDLQKAGQILYISSVDISVGDGPGVNEREFILALHKMVQDRAHFLIPQPKDAVPDLPGAVCTFSAPHQRHNPRHFLRHIFSQCRLADQLLAQRHFDLCVFRLDILPFGPFYVAKRHQVPYAIKTLGQGLVNVGAINVFADRFAWFGQLPAKLNLWMIRQIVQGAVAIDTVSQLHIQYLQNTLGLQPDQLVAIDNSVNTDRFYPMSTAAARQTLGLEKFWPIIGYVGHLPHEQGGTQLISAVPTLLRKYPNLGIVILGDGKGPQSLQELAQQLGVADHCRLTGYVPFAQVPTYINAFDAGVSFLLPKRQAASEQKVRQYLACGKPVVATTPGSNDFLATANLGSLVHHEDIATIAHELDRWVGMPAAERAQFSQRAAQYARQHLSVEQAVAQRLAYWNERLNAPAGGSRYVYA